MSENPYASPLTDPEGPTVMGMVETVICKWAEFVFLVLPLGLGVAVLVFAFLPVVFCSCILGVAAEIVCWLAKRSLPTWIDRLCGVGAVVGSFILPAWWWFVATNIARELAR